MEQEKVMYDNLPKMITPDMSSDERDKIWKLWHDEGVLYGDVYFRSDPEDNWSISISYGVNSLRPVPHPCVEYMISSVPPLDYIPTQSGQKDAINPDHYTSHPSGIECLTIIRHMPFCIGSAIKYLWRLDLKYNGQKDIEDLKKAIRYLEEEIDLRSKHATK
jgi:hypothetical protein